MIFKKINYSARPRKILLYKLIEKFLRNKKNLNIIDFGCGDGQLKNLVNFKSYTGVDIDKSLIKKNNIKKSDKVTFINKNFLNFKINKKYDLVVCLQVLGFNKNFYIMNTVKTLKKISKYVKKDGYLIFNISSKLISESIKIENLLKEKFIIVDKINYGNFKDKKNIIITKFIVFLILSFNLVNYIGNKNKLYFLKKK